MKHADVVNWLQDEGLCSLVPLAKEMRWSGNSLSQLTVPHMRRMEKAQAPQERRLSAPLLKLTLTPKAAFIGSRSDNSSNEESMDRKCARLYLTTPKSKAKKLPRKCAQAAGLGLLDHK